MIDSCSECPIITYEIVKKLDFEKDKSLLNITDKVVSDIVKQVLANLDISQRNRTLSEAKRKKTIFNNTASESLSESGSSSESSYDNEDFTIDMNLLNYLTPSLPGSPIHPDDIAC
ncbi:14137_t:CDS:2 [Cetraspora pellucida]|uniref:14137_t:CDS:1 n=1 Tax=Cetraspora pellucida TaxID=1433469 RepID=A0A9N9HZN9_9GLOM|nr:14137_t:CDS:2 [Cetraspora pellucida]